MYFLFFTCEVICGAVALDIADRQNAHSMTLAVRGVVELYRTVKREKELNREIHAFSVYTIFSTTIYQFRAYGKRPNDRVGRYWMKIEGAKKHQMGVMFSREPTCN